MPFPFKRARKQEPAAFPRSILDAVKSFYAVERREPQLKPPKHERRSTGHPQGRGPHASQHAARQSIRRPRRITELPNELLAHIFVLGAEEDVMFPITVSHVCRAWRYTALHTPTLWRRITLDGSLSMWSHRMCRAKACTLDIRLCPRSAMSHLAYYNHVQLCMHLVVPQIHRWRSLEVRFTGYAPFLWNAALSACCGHSPSIEAPALRELTLVYPENEDTKEFALFNGFAPRLRRATLQGIRLAWLPPLFQNLTYLDYTHHGFTRGAQAASEVLYMLQVSVGLEELRLAFPWKGDTASRYALSASFSRAVHLPRLRKLALYIDGPDVPPALTYTLPHLSLPMLRSLYLMSPHTSRYMHQTDTFPHLRNILKSFPRLPAISHLHVAYAWLDERFLASLLAMLPHPGTPHLTLTLEGPQASHAFLCNALRHVGRRLRAIALIRCDKLTAEAVVDVLNRLSGAPLQSVLGVVPAVSALYVRECREIDWRSLQWLVTLGIGLKVWEGGREVDMRYARARKKARFGPR
ncbi:hypothetical protein OH76DRAFT_1402677 [Lentinus brumalis]|uniref:F-box domain-containing protein n=1 Tax=Lentinus brumalis TaxID=2498619 RepID=A0A371DCG9_9APHY|nr:hypothetical protein OH76DRAFT_1402677 [Polyporus brumalis]